MMSWIESELFFRMAVIVPVAVSKGVRAYYMKRHGIGRPSELSRDNRLEALVSLWLVSLVPQLTLMVYVIVPHWIGWAAAGIPVPVRWSGLLLGLGSIGFFIWTHVVLGRNFSLVLRVREDHELRTDGPYRWVRHPIYTFGLALAVTFFPISSNWVVAAGCIGGTALGLLYRIPREEAGLIERFGDRYRAYKKTTGCLVPRLRQPVR